MWFLRRQLFFNSDMFSIAINSHSCIRLNHGYNINTNTETAIKLMITLVLYKVKSRLSQNCLHHQFYGKQSYYLKNFVESEVEIDK